MNEAVRNRLEVQGVEERGGGWYELPSGEKVRGARNTLQRLGGGRSNGRGRQTEIVQLSHLDPERVDFARKAGLQYDGDRDIREVAGYKRDLTVEDYFARYDRQDIAGRLVDMAPQATWRNPPTIHEEEDRGSEFIDALEQLTGRDDLRFWSRMERTDRQARLGRFGGLLIGQATATDRDLSEPLEEMDGPSDVIFLSSFDERHISIEDFVTAVDDPRHGQAETYMVDLSSGAEGFPSKKVEVHWSRIIHVAEDLLADEVFGRPALKRVFNRLFDLQKITAATAEAYWQLADKILVASIDPESSFDDDEALGEALEEMVHDLRRQFGAQGISLDWIGGETPDPSDAVNLYMTLIASAALPGIPKRMLFGSETGERASTQDKKTWHETISSRQEHHAEPMLLRALIDRLIEFGALPEPATNYIVEWPSLFELPENEEAEIDEMRAKAAKALTPVGGDPGELTRINEEGRVELVPTEEA